MKKVAVMIADGTEEIEALTVVDVMRRAQNVYVNQKSETQTRINEMTNGWEDILY